MGRICITLPDSIEEKITTEADAQHVTKSDWVSTAIDQYLRTRDQDCERIREEWQACRITLAVMEERANQLNARAVHAEGLVQSLMVERMIPERTEKHWWQFWK